MCSKLISKFSSLLTGIIIVTVLAGCKMPWGEQPSEPSPPKTKLGEEAKCLSGLTPVITGFMDGSADPARVTQVWTCFDDALGLFQRKVRSEDPKFYSARELANFFEEYFLDEDVRINDRLLTEVMRFKQLFVGGENLKLTRDELTRLREFARQMRDLSTDLLPHMKLLSMNWKVTGEAKFEQDLKQFEQSKIVAQQTVMKLAALIEPQQQKYELANFVVLLEELQVVFKKKWTFTQELGRLMPLLGRLKGVLTGTEEAVIQPQDWRLFGNLGIRSYSQFLRYYYFFENNPHREKDPELILVFRSVDDLLQMVSEILKQKAGASLDRNEIVSVLRAVADVYIEFTIPEAFVDEMMKVKKLFFGGDVTRLTPEDLDRARVKLEDFRTLANLLTQNSIFIEGKWKPDELPADQAQQVFAKAEESVITFMQILAPLLESSYDLKDFSKLIESYELAFPPAEKENAVTPQIQRLMPMFIKGKELILAQSGSVVQKEDWSFLTDVLARGYVRFLEFQYFLKEKSFYRPPGLPLFQKWIESLADFSGYLFKARGRGASLPIEIREIDAVIVTLEKAGLWPAALPSESVSDVLPVLVRRALTPPENRARGVYEKNLSPVGISVISTELQLFFSVQRKMAQLLSGSKNLIHGKLQAAFGLNNNLGDKEISRLLGSSVPLALDREGRLYLNPAAQLAYSEQALVRLNLIRAGIRWMIRGYGDPGSANKLYGLSEGQFQRAYLDFKPTLVKLGLIESSNMTFASSRFLEGNLFTPFSDGDDFLDYNEAGTLAALIWSGQAMFGQVKTEIESRCAVRGTRKAYYGVDCSLEIIRRNSAQVFAAMPGMAKLFANGNKDQTTGLLNEVLRSAGWAPNSQRIASMSDISLVPHVIQYIESLYRRWDRNGDGILDREEALRSEPMFHALLKKVSGLDDDSYVRAAFAFILVKGKAPETFWEKFEFSTGWVGKENDWPIQADRYRIGQILGFIADSVRNGKKAKIELVEE